MDALTLTPTDDELMAELVAGEHAALRVLFERHAPWVARRLRRTLPAAVVEDVLQETFIAIWRGAAAYAGTGDVGGWIWGIARRQAALWARRHHRSELMLDGELGVTAASDPAQSATTRADLERAFVALGPDERGRRERELARLVFAEERSTADVASLLDIPSGTVKSRVHALRRKLRAALGAGTEA